MRPPSSSVVVFFTSTWHGVVSSAPALSFFHRLIFSCVFSPSGGVSCCFDCVFHRRVFSSLTLLITILNPTNCGSLDMIHERRFSRNSLSASFLRDGKVPEFSGSGFIPFCFHHPGEVIMAALLRYFSYPQGPSLMSTAATFFFHQRSAIVTRPEIHPPYSLLNPVLSVL